MYRKYIKTVKKSTKETAQKIMKGMKNDFFEESDLPGLHQMLGERLSQLSLDIGACLTRMFLEREIEYLCGPKNGRDTQRKYYRHGQQLGYAYLAGQRVPVERLRVQMKQGGEVELESYKRMQDKGCFNQDVMRRLLLGVSSRNYDEVIEHASERCGVSKSAVSASFTMATKLEIDKIVKRDLSQEHWVVVYMDGNDIAGETMIAALGITITGEKRVLGLRQGGTENKEVASELIKDIRDRGLRYEEGILFVTDGSKALKAAIKENFGEYASIQRCRVHKRRNVLAHVPKNQQTWVGKQIDNAYKEKDTDKARKELQSIAENLEKINPDAAGSMREGLEETLTILKFGLPDILTKTLMSTNPIESIFSMTENVIGRVKRWRGNDMRRRWLCAALMYAEKRCNRIRGYLHLSQLSEALKKNLTGVEKSIDKVEKAA